MRKDKKGKFVLGIKKKKKKSNTSVKLEFNSLITLHSGLRLLSL